MGEVADRVRQVAMLRIGRILLMRRGLVCGVLAASLTMAGHAVSQQKSYTYESDPPEGSVPCGKTATVKSSKKCGGNPATVIGGCKSSGTRRQTKCEK
jgi:hypothetical protein